MLAYQEKYIENVKKIAELCDFYAVTAPDFDSWTAKQRSNRQTAEQLRKENNDLLSTWLFPRLDDLHNTSAEEIAALEEFAAVLMDWNSNLDCGMYVLIHDALLRMYRIRKDRKNIIKELYMTGMGLYYQTRSILGVESERSRAFQFRNEMLFTEAASYLKFFEEIEDEATKGYIIRSVANVAIATPNLKKKVHASGLTLRIVQDDYYKNLAPSLPWATFLSRTHQQMSSNRRILSRGNLSPEELALVLESCQVVFKPESVTDNPNIRWLWPYYEMEYSCGFVDLKTTMARMRQLIDSIPTDQYDVSSLYANVQLPLYYGRLIRDNASLREDPAEIKFLAHAYQKAKQLMTTWPSEKIDNYFAYAMSLMITDYQEMEGVESYQNITTALMRRFGGQLYIEGTRVGNLMRLFAEAVYSANPAFFDDIPAFAKMKESEEKKQAVAEYAALCGLYHDFGLIKMNFEHTLNTRELFEDENLLYELHTISGHDDLAARPSTEMFADIALGHHAWYNGAKGYPQEYVRSESPYRQMTDLAAIVVYLSETGNRSLPDRIRDVLDEEGKRFSPLLTPYLTDKTLTDRMAELLSSQDESCYRTIYQEIGRTFRKTPQNHLAGPETVSGR